MAGQIEKYIKGGFGRDGYKLSNLCPIDPLRSYFILKITIAKRIRCAVGNGKIS